MDVSSPSRTLFALMSHLVALITIPSMFVVYLSSLAIYTLERTCEKFVHVKWPASVQAVDLLVLRLLASTLALNTSKPDANHHQPRLYVITYLHWASTSVSSDQHAASHAATSAPDHAYANLEIAP